MRLKNWDYGSPGYYYVTICTRDRKKYLGDVTTSCKNHIHGMHCWKGLCDGIGDAHSWDGSCRGIHSWGGSWGGSCDGIGGTHDYASLPPTAHPAHESEPPAERRRAIVQLTPIGKIAYQNWVDIPKHFPFVSLDEFVVMPDHVHGLLCFKKPGYRETNVNSFGPQSKNLGSVLRGFKAATKAAATAQHIEFAWQPRYYDDVVTSGKALDRIRQYIRNNPERWAEKNK